MPVTIKKAAPSPAPVKVPLTALPDSPAPSAKLTGKQPVGTVSKQYKDGTTSEVAVPVGPPIITLEPHATVGLSMSLTRNLGNFESVKFTVSLYLPCAPEPEEIDATYLSAKEWVDSKTESINQDITDQLG